MPAKEKPLNFESKLAQLESLVSKIEEGNLSLDESLKAYEEGIKITRECRETLDKAEQKVEILANDMKQKAEK